MVDLLWCSYVVLRVSLVAVSMWTRMVQMQSTTVLVNQRPFGDKQVSNGLHYILYILGM